MAFKIGIDVGGTFTDFVATDGSQQFAGKVPTRPDDEATSVLEAVEAISIHFDARSVSSLLGETDHIVLGTTVVTNTMLEYSGVRTGLLTTDGFRDVLEMRRGFKESLFDLALPAPQPIIPRRWRRGVPERMDFTGAVVEPLDEDRTRSALRELREAGVEAVAVCLLFSFVNDSHERRVAELAAEEIPGCFVSLSCDVLPQIREFERVSTTAVNAYTSPKLRNYLQRLDARLREEQFEGSLLVMQSNGGVMDIAFSIERGVDAVLSGPAGGVVAAVRLGELSGHNNLITADMGGTSYDVCLIHDGKPEVGVDQWISRYRVAVPLLDIHTIGAGGGSIAWVDDGGALRVGPESAGAYPGPACYGRGGERPTVTDANLILGYMDPERFLGGSMELDRDAADAAMEQHVGRPLGLGVTDAAVGVVRIANNSMSNALRYVSVSRGRDPREYALMAFGGAGAIHAGAQAMEVGIKTILVPRNASVMSAYGGLTSDFKVSRIQSHVRDVATADLDEVNDIFMQLQTEAERLLGAAGSVDEVRVDRFLDLHYTGQVQEVIVPLRSRTRRITQVNLARAVRDFHELHEKLYAFKRPNDPMEIVSLRLELTGAREPIPMRARPFGGEAPDAGLLGTRSVYMEDAGFVETAIYDGAKLEPGNLVAGPAIIHEPDTTIVVYPRQEAMLDQFQTYVIEVVE